MSRCTIATASLLVVVMASAALSAFAVTAVQAQATADPDTSLEERVEILTTDVDKLAKFKLSGYVQARWESAENQSDTVRVAGSPATFTAANRQRFFIRRARLKLTYEAGPRSQAVVYFDGGTDRTIRLLEAYVTLFDPWTAKRRHSLTVGQLNVPFGYELERSSAARELPERSRAENVLFPGERDRGLKIVSRWTDRVETTLGVWNGGGINHPEFPNTDPTRGKDVTGRLRWSGDRFAAAVSGYAGEEVLALTGSDIELDKTRLGFDAQANYEVSRLGKGSLTGEAYLGENVNPDSVAALVVAPTPANPVRLLEPGADPDHLVTDFLGWYVMWVQDLGKHFQFAARYDVFDPNTDINHDRFDRFNVGVNAFYDRFTRITLAYEIPMTDAPLGGGEFDDPKDNVWTVQFQHRF